MAKEFLKKKLMDAGFDWKEQKPSVESSNTANNDNHQSEITLAAGY
jgi:hypothetical protein